MRNCVGRCRTNWHALVALVVGLAFDLIAVFRMKPEDEVLGCKAAEEMWERGMDRCRKGGKRACGLMYVVVEQQGRRKPWVKETEVASFEPGIPVRAV